MICSKSSLLVLWMLQCAMLSVEGLPGQIRHWGRCPTVSVQQNFTIDPYEGVWYLQLAYNHFGVDESINCFLEKYTTLNETAGLLQVRQTWINTTAVLMEKQIGNLTQVEPDQQEGNFEVTFLDESGDKVTKPYWILGTDYTSYSVVYSCTPHWIFWHYQTIMVFSRYSTFPDLLTEEILRGTAVDLLYANGLLFDNTLMANQINCALP